MEISESIVTIISSISIALGAFLLGLLLRHAEKISTIEKQVDHNKEDINKVGSRIDPMENNLKERIDSLRDELLNMENNLKERIDSRGDELHNKIDILTHSIGEAEKKYV